MKASQSLVRSESDSCLLISSKLSREWANFATISLGFMLSRRRWCDRHLEVPKLPLSKAWGSIENFIEITTYIEYHHRCFGLGGYFMATVLEATSYSRIGFSLYFAMCARRVRVPGGSKFHLEPGKI